MYTVALGVLTLTIICACATYGQGLGNSQYRAFKVPCPREGRACTTTHLARVQMLHNLQYSQSHVATKGQKVMESSRRTMEGASSGQMTQVRPPYTVAVVGSGHCVTVNTRAQGRQCQMQAIGYVIVAPLPTTGTNSATTTQPLVATSARPGLTTVSRQTSTSQLPPLQRVLIRAVVQGGSKTDVGKMFTIRNLDTIMIGSTNE